jgi:predicted GIY-YIG superfamily endonuclease
MEFDRTHCRIYEPAGGSGEFLKLAAQQLELITQQNEHLKQVTTNKKLISSDVLPPNITAREIVKLISSDFLPQNITVGGFYNKEFFKKADVILSHPWTEPPNETIRKPTITSNKLHPQREEPWIYILINSLTWLSEQGRGAFFLPITSLFSNKERYKEIRNLFVGNDSISCILTLPNTFKYSEDTPGCIWFLTKNKNEHEGIVSPQQILFINGKEILLKKHLSNEGNEGLQENCCVNIEDLVEIINEMRRGITSEKYKKVERFFKYVTLEEIATKNYILTSEVYTGYAEKPKVEYDYGINGIKTAAFFQDNALAIRFERDLLKQSEKIFNLEKPGIYILIGKQQEPENSKCNTILYIGETEEIIRRLKEHNKDRKNTFWNSTVILTTINDEFPLNKSECCYLETKLLQILKEVGKVVVVNKRSGNLERKIAKEWEIYSRLNKYLYLLSELEITLFRP